MPNAPRTQRPAAQWADAWMKADICGTEPGYRRHARDREVPCLACVTAHSDAARARDLYRKALHGLEPAEALPTAYRHRLVAELHRRGWTDTEIAAHTRMTTYTTTRIRAQLGLHPNTTTERAA